MNLTESEVMDLNSGLKALEDKHFARAVQLLSTLAEKGEPEGVNAEYGSASYGCDVPERFRSPP